MRNDRCVAAIYGSCKIDFDAFELVDQYIEAKKTSPHDDSDRDSLVSVPNLPTLCFIL